MSENNLSFVLRQLGIIDEGVYYINDEGKIVKQGFIDEKTGVYIDENGKIKKESFPADEYTGLYLKNGKFYKSGLVDEYTGVYLDDNNRFKVEGFLIDEDTGVYIDDQGRFKKQGFLVDGTDLSEEINYNAKSQSKSSGGSFFSGFEFNIYNIIGIIIAFFLAIFMLLYLLLIALNVLPSLLLYFYFKTRKKWLLIASAVTALYLVGDVFLFKGTLYKMIQTNLSATFSYIFGGIGLVTLGIAIYYIIIKFSEE